MSLHSTMKYPLALHLQPLHVQFINFSVKKLELRKLLNRYIMYIFIIQKNTNVTVYCILFVTGIFTVISQYFDIRNSHLPKLDTSNTCKYIERGYMNILSEERDSSRDLYPIFRFIDFLIVRID